MNISPAFGWQGRHWCLPRRLEDARWRQGQEDLFVTRRDGDGWTVPQPLRGLNTLNNEGAAALSGDGMTICFTVCRDADRNGEGPHKGSCDLYLAQREGQAWGKPQNLSSVNTAGWESQPCLSPDGQQLFFTRGSGRSGSRKYDLFTARQESRRCMGYSLQNGRGGQFKWKRNAPLYPSRWPALLFRI